MRSMVLEFTEDRNTAYLDKQYMLGDSLLVAPIFNDESIAEFYLPEGKWTNYFTGKVYEGGKWYTESCDYLHIPLMARENSIVAINTDAPGPDYDYSENLTFRVFGLTDKAETTVYNMDKSVAAHIEAVKTGNNITLTVETAKPCKVELVGLDKVIDCAGSMTMTITI